MSLTKVSFSMINGAVFNALDYGAVGDGNADDTQAIKDVIAAAVASDGVAYLPPGTYKCTDVITLDVGSCRFIGNNATLLWSTIPSGAAAFVITGYGKDEWGTTIIAKNVAHRIEGITFNCSALSGKINVLLNGPGPNGENGGVKFDRCVFFVGPAGTGVYVGSQSYLVSFLDCYFATEHTVNRLNTYGVTIGSGTNTSENITFVGCIFDSLGNGLQINNGFASLTNCTIDYFSQNGIQMYAGTCHLVNCNMETTAASHWIYLEGEYPSIFIQNCRLDIATASGSFDTNIIAAINTVDPSYYNMVNIDGLFLSINSGYSYPPVYLIGGNGKVKATKVAFQKGGPNWPISAQANLIYDSGFSNPTADALIWTNIGSGPTFTGTNMTITGVAGASRGAYVDIPASPGDVVSGVVDYVTSSFSGTGTEFDITFSWLSAGKYTITSGDVLTSTTNTSATNYLLNYGVPAPAGTNYLRIKVVLTTASAGSGTAVIDNISATLS